MKAQYEDLINHIYDRFNARDIDAILVYMDKDVHWPNGWEGGYVDGHEALKDYWTRQWKELDPYVEPLSIITTDEGDVEVEVHQVAKDKKGVLLFEGKIKHVYSFQNGLIKGMKIDKH
ncbi:MAG: nuclear transport factor 2 family protein [Chitinophagaceae bacterium]|nr:MAG: nuclear transport factor 2 family protein [Chitinophagaceae bacterium]